jgi:mannose-1-phosphate guanylyltransferase / mannose-6-phosphate isomerase
LRALESVTPVVLCGGRGTRLWPVSRQNLPKQFVCLSGEESLFTTSIRRMARIGLAAPMVVTGAPYRFLVRDHMPSDTVAADCILVEPEPRNTAPAILAAALHLHRRDPSGLMLVTPSDHMIRDEALFSQSVLAAKQAAVNGALVTFGVEPTRAETGYGYLELRERGQNGEAVPLRGFVEKPDEPGARSMVASGNHLWNAGIFLFRVDRLIHAYEVHAPDLLEVVGASVDAMETDLDFMRLHPEPWAQARNISIDYAIMEKSDQLMAVPYHGRWSDMGDWRAVWQEAEADEEGVVISGNTMALGCTNSYLRSHMDGPEVVGIGLDDTVVVATSDAVLVSSKSNVQEVKLAVDALKAKGSPQADSFPRDQKPWGWYETLALSDRFQVKRIVVKPGAALSLQSHVHRSEHWIVVSGTAQVTVEDDVKLISENESVYIPLGAKHRLENPGKLPMVLIEVQTGAYLGEDDIVRYEDAYART